MKKIKKFTKARNLLKISSLKSRILVFVVAFAFAGSILLRVSFAASSSTYYWNTTNLITGEAISHQTGTSNFVQYFPGNYPSQQDATGMWFSSTPGPVAWYGPYANKSVGNPSGIGMRVCFTVAFYAGGEFPVYYQFDAVSQERTFWALNQRGWDWANYMQNKVHGSYLAYRNGDLGASSGQALPYAAGRICRDLQMPAGSYHGIQFRASMTACYTYYYTSEKCRLYIKKVNVDYH